MTPRQRYVLDQAPRLLGSAMELEAFKDDPYQVLRPAEDLHQRAVARAAELAAAIYDHVMDAHAPAPTNPEPADSIPPCPHKAIIDLYHEFLPMCPRVRTWTDARAALLRQRWREHPDLDWWRGYFSYVAESSFLTGRTHGKDRRPFLADLEWLIRPAQYARVHEGKYHGL